MKDATCPSLDTAHRLSLTLCLQGTLGRTGRLSLFLTLSDSPSPSQALPLPHPLSAGDFGEERKVNYVPLSLSLSPELGELTIPSGLDNAQVSPPKP